MTISLSKVPGSTKSAHQLVVVDDAEAGEIWREQARVVVSKLTEPRRMAIKWRWFAKRTGENDTLGRGNRAALLLGPGFKSKDEAIEALNSASTSN